MRSRLSLGLACSFAFVISSQLVCAAPAESSDASLSLTAPTASHTRPVGISTTRESEDESHTRSTTGPPDGNSDREGSRSSTHRPITFSSSHSIIIPPTPTRHFPHPTGDRTPGYPITYSRTPHSRPSATAAAISQPAHHGQSTVAIVFEVVGAALAFFILFALARCFYSYRRTPPRDRIGAFMSRHQLEREIEELERNRLQRFAEVVDHYRWHPPPPPYQPAPAYEEVTTSDGSIDWGRPSFPAATHPPTP
ncbi:hypothetical protein C8Q74DRAFT_836717 [Fomes fomentarius]|nr:hypothetical protein C8Q74DRAFT_836717 [Fomes fomentarius]